MHPDTLLVIQLQNLDCRAADLEKEISSLPRHIATIEKALESHVRRLEADQAALGANLKERKAKEGDIQLQNQKISKLRDQMLGAKNNEQYRAFQHEIEYLEKEIRQAEDRILELMTESEPLDAAVKTAEVALKAEKQAVEAEKTKARERTLADQQELKKLQSERAAVAAKLPPPALAAYARIRKKWMGVAISELDGVRCSVCQIVLRPQFIQDLKKSGQMKPCENCARFVYYNPPVNVEDLAG